MLELYASTREHDLAALGLDEGQSRGFLEMQLKAQSSHYKDRFPGAEDHVVLVDDEPVGRLWLCTNEDEIRVLDIAIMPGRRSEGLGSMLMKSVMADARASGRVVRLTVRRDNPRAVSFYARLGFEVEAEDELNLSMTC